MLVEPRDPVLGSPIPEHLRDALARAQAGRGGLAVLGQGHSRRDAAAITAAVVETASRDGWCVARARGEPLDRARPLALTRRLIESAGGTPEPLPGAAVAALALQTVGGQLASTAPAGAGLLVVEDAQECSRACLRVFHRMATGLAALPVLLLVTVVESPEENGLALRRAAPDALAILTGQ